MPPCANCVHAFQKQKVWVQRGRSRGQPSGLKTWNFEGALGRQLLDRMGPDLQEELWFAGARCETRPAPKAGLQTPSNHNKNALFYKQGCHTFANNESKTVI